MRWEQAMSMEEIGKKRNRVGERVRERREEGLRRKVEGNGLSEGRTNEMDAGKEYGERDWEKEK